MRTKVLQQRAIRELHRVRESTFFFLTLIQKSQKVPLGRSPNILIRMPMSALWLHRFKTQTEASKDQLNDSQRRCHSWVFFLKFGRLLQGSSLAIMVTTLI